MANAGSKKTLQVALGDSRASLVRKNAYLSASDISDGRFVRLSLNGPTIVHYDDGDLRFEICAERISADNAYDRSNRVTLVELRACESFDDNPGAALEVAEDFMRQFRARNPHARDISSWYASATDAEVEEFEGRRVDRTSDLYQPTTSGDALQRFEQLLVAARSTAQPQLDFPSGNALLAIFEGSNAAVSVTVGARKAMGGENLTFEQERSVNFSVTVSVVPMRHSRK